MRSMVVGGEEYVLADRYIVNVEGAIVRDGRYLMVVRGEEEFAPGGLSLPGGKVEGVHDADNVLEETLRREIKEEVGLEVGDEMAYLRSSAFLADGDPVVDVVFLCRWKRGTAVALDPAEVAEVRWMTLDEATAHPETPPWTAFSLKVAENERLTRGW
jgi:8-oxo-dGTP diphosphatase